MRQGEDDMEIADWQDLGPAGLKPALLVEPLALRAMAVAAGIVGRFFKAAAVAPLKMPAQGGGAAAFDGAHEPELITGRLIGAAEVIAVEAENIRQFQARLFARGGPGRPRVMAARHGRAVSGPAREPAPAEGPGDSWSLPLFCA